MHTSKYLSKLKQTIPPKGVYQRKGSSDEKEREKCKKVEGRREKNQSREPPLAATNTWLDLPVCPHDSQSGQLTHNKLTEISLYNVTRVHGRELIAR